MLMVYQSLSYVTYCVPISWSQRKIRPWEDRWGPAEICQNLAVPIVSHSSFVRATAQLVRATAQLVRATAQLVRATAQLVRATAQLVRSCDSAARSCDSAARSCDSAARSCAAELSFWATLEVVWWNCAAFSLILKHKPYTGMTLPAALLVNSLKLFKNFSHQHEINTLYVGMLYNSFFDYIICAIQSSYISDGVLGKGCFLLILPSNLISRMTFIFSNHKCMAKILLFLLIYIYLFLLMLYFNLYLIFIDI